nr:hypothetical protein DA06_24490 [Georgenia sp. SUBG003]
MAGGDVGGERRRHGGEDAARDGRQDGGEREPDGVRTGGREVLLDLRDVPVGPADRVGGERPEALGREEVRPGGLAGTGVAHGEDGDDVGRIDQAGRDAGLEGEGHGGDVAAWHRDAACGAQPLALALTLVGEDQLGQAVRPRPGVVAAVELLPGGCVGEAVVRSAVEDEGVRAGLLERRSDLARRTVRQGEDDDVVAGERLGGRGLQDPLRERTQVRVVGVKALPGAGVRRQRTDLGVGMVQEQAQHLAAGVAGGACDGDGEGHLHNHTALRMPCRRGRGSSRHPD